MEYLNTFDLIHKYQSGFRAGHSTESALLLMTERWLKALDEGKVVGSVMVDFRKAFDLVDHTLLLEKLSCYRVSDNFFQLMKSYIKLIKGFCFRICSFVFSYVNIHFCCICVYIRKCSCCC